MKIFAFIMSIVVLTLSMVPCADAGAASQNHLKAEINSAHQHKNDWQDQCSPFCHCNCCSSASSHQFTAFTLTKPSFAKKLQSEFLSSSIIEIALPIWQPPQLV
jgi:hypothetical protein